MDVQKTTATIYKDVIQLNLEPNEAKELVSVLQQSGIHTHFVDYLINKVSATLECPF